MLCIPFSAIKLVKKPCSLLTGFSIAILLLLYRTNSGLIIVYALFSFFMTLIREIIKDMEDLKGDNTYDYG